MYSAWARFGEMLGLSAKRELMPLMFGQKHIKYIRFDVEKYVEIFSNRLPKGTRYSASYLINNHTLYPLYAAFLPKSKAHQLYDNFLTGSLSKQRILSFLKKRGDLPKYARYCPLCVQVDLEKYRETYWHRIHQIPNLEVCGIHNCWLENSKLCASLVTGKFDTAKKVVSDVKPRYISKTYDKNYSNLQMFFYECATYFLLQGDKHIYLEEILGRYRSIFLQRGYMKLDGEVILARLYKQAKGRISHKTFERLKIISSKNGYSASRAINPFTKWTLSPANHFLIVYVLKYSANTFLKDVPTDYFPFGDGPWPCQNPVCKQYQKRVIREVIPCMNNRKYYGRFVCDCGLSYIRRYGGIEAGQQRDIIYTVGNTLHKMMGEKIENRAKKVKRIMQSLGVPERLARELIAAWNRENREQVLENKHRRVLDAIIKSNPKISRNDLLLVNRVSFDWMRRNRPSYLDAKLSTPRQIITRQAKINMMTAEELVEFDKEQSGAVKNLYKKILQKQDRPYRITKTALLRGAKVIRSYIYVPEKLPLLQKTMQDLAESREDFARRYVSWIVAGFSVSGEIPTIGKYRYMIKFEQNTEVIKSIVENGYQQIVKTLTKKE
jgi:hypothetical protein